MTITSKRKRVTDPNGAPTPGLNQPSNEPSDEPPVVQETPKVYTPAKAPSYLRPARLVVGLALLAAAYGVALLVYALGLALWLTTPSQPVLTLQLALYALEALGLLWLTIIGVGMVIVGLFSLFLGLTRRGW